MALQDTDLFVVGRNDESYKITYDDLKTELGAITPEPPPEDITIEKPSVLTPPDGAGIGGDVTYTPETSAITGAVDVPGGWNAVAATEANPWFGVTYGNGKFVAVAGGGSNRVMYSTDALSWTATTAPGSTQWNSVTYGNSKFVAVGQSGSPQVMYSTDGINWSEGQASVGNVWKAVTYGNNIFVAVSSNGSNPWMYSSDGSNWTTGTTSDSTHSYPSVTYGDGKFVAVSAPGQAVAYSTDGDTWVILGTALPESSSWKVTYGNGKFVAASSAGFAYSTDAISWTAVANNVSASTPQSITYGDGKFLVVTNASTDVLWSTDGINWNLATGTEANSWYSVTYGDGKFVAISSNGTNRVMWSPTGADAATELTLTDSKTYNNADGSDMGQPISETFTAGQTVKGESTSGTYGAPTPAFSTTIYTGIASQLNTGIDNTGKALVWIKNRDNNDHHNLADTVRGKDNVLWSDAADAESDSSGNLIQEFNSTGVILGGGYSGSNASGKKGVCWNFRAAPGFMDIVTYTGTGTRQTIPHSLGTKPGFIIIKNTDTSVSWRVYHQELTQAYYLRLDGDFAQSGAASIWGGTEPTANEFTVDTDSGVNKDKNNHVAYLFADTPGLIKCGSYTGPEINPEINCGFQPGWVMIKRTDSAVNWVILDNKRNSNTLMPNLSNSEKDESSWSFVFTSNGFSATTGWNEISGNGNYIYVAIAEDALAGEFFPTGELTADADAANSTITLTNTTGDWTEAGLKVVNDTEATKEAPGASGIVFTSSEPDTTEGTVTSWGSAEWELSTSSDFSTDLQEQSVSLTDSGVQTGPNFTLADGTEYYVRTKYNSSDPVEVSEVSTANHFKTAGAGVPDVKDLFSTTLYTGDGAYPTINTGIDNTGKALAWIKARNGSNKHCLSDTERDGKEFLSTNSSAAQERDMYGINAKLINGFSIGPSTLVNVNAETYVAWNFKAAPGFMDVVTYSGTSSTQNIPHSLAAIPGVVICKPTSTTGNWRVYHQSLGNDKELLLNSTNQEANSAAWDDTTPTSTEFTVSADDVNASGENYVAYLFADTPGLIKCGSYVGNNDNINPPQVDVGFTLGWIMIKDVSDSGGWFIFDTTRGIVNGKDDSRLYADTSDAENNNNYYISLINNGFEPVRAGVNEPGNNYIYIAIADPTTTAYYDEVNTRAVSQHELVRRFGVDADSTNLRNQGIYPLINQPTGTTEAFVKEGDAYRAIPNRSMEVFHAQQEAEEANERLDDAAAEIASLRSALEVRIAALEADHMTLMNDNNNNNGGY